MKHSDIMQPIIIKGTDESKAAKDAYDRSFRSGGVTRVLKESRIKLPVVKGKPRW